ncbi:thiamine-monophosphate kinase [Runella defluvii]|uniref:Thiamine-monophosphate kinase n=1 Tax=Runella defluvii TaxID=370973 RepID=A0A7W5ZHP8_9BACT|nr:thiamine-phosphate kinase [Runella defluvii]MBB3837483.1 thiamine-monophosphate kinase [Runella defluvii]
MTRTELSTLGEFGLIERINQQFTPVLPQTIKGIGDDAAVIDTGSDEYTLVSTDMLIEGVHFDLSYAPLKHLGFKAVAVNVSDIAAMNGTPRQITVSIGLSNRFSVEAIDELYAGIQTACEAYKVDLVGGDTSASRSGLVLSVTAIGTVKKDKIAYRNGAQPNDVICVTGDLGAAYLGLQLLEREKREFLENPNMQPQLEDKAYLIGRQLKPEARTNIIYELNDADLVPTSMIDVSDGLASEILHLCKQSGTGAQIFEEHIPVADETFLTADEFKLSPLTSALNGGEDYELLFTIKQTDYEKIKNSPHISFIGFMTNDPSAVEIVTKGGGRFPVQAQGWQHLTR